MSRSTQYIGLTSAARKYVRKAVSQRRIHLTEGMFQEEIFGTEYELPPPRGPNKKLIVREVPDQEPWSSGPMIFTCLELVVVKECGQELPPVRAYQWVFNPELEGEFDPDLGHFNV